MTTRDFLLLGLAAFGAGGVNALAGGGTLLSFPALLALGVPPIAANVTNAIALCPGYFGATLAQRRHLEGQSQWVRACMPAAIAGGLVGAFLLLRTHERTFQALVPYMLCIASLLLALQERVKAFAIRQTGGAAEPYRSRVLPALAVFVAAVYGGFFSAGMSVILLAVLAVTIHETFARLNALKQIAAFSVNVAAAAFFLFSDQVIWSAVLVMALGALLGGAVGGHAASRLNPTALRWGIVTIGWALAIYYWVRA